MHPYYEPYPEGGGRSEASDAESQEYVRGLVDLWVDVTEWYASGGSTGVTAWREGVTDDLDLLTAELFDDTAVVTLFLVAGVSPVDRDQTA